MKYNPLYIGIPKETELSESRRLILNNILTIIGITVNFIYFFFLLSMGKYLISTFNLACGVIFGGMGLLLMYKKKYNIAKVFNLIAIPACLVVFNFIYGDLNFNLIFVLFVISAFFVLDNRKITYLLILWLFAVTLFINVGLAVDMIQPYDDDTAYWGRIFYWSNFVIGFICTVILLAVFKFENLRYEKRIQEKSEQVIQQNEEIQSINNQLQKYNDEITAQRTEIISQKNELQSTLDHLTLTQTELIQSEKMASLGQLIAGIAHEINTPLGAIKSSISTITDSTTQSLKMLPELLKVLSESDLKLFMELIDKSVKNNSLITSKEEREFRKKILIQLEKNNIADAEEMADTLVDMGIYDDIEKFYPLLKPQPIETAYCLTMQIKNSNNIKIAVDRAAKVVFALKNYAHFANELSMVSANIIDGIETVLILYHNQLKQGIKLHKEFGEIPLLLCYPDELNQVWTNLIHNSIQAMSGKGELTIKVESIQGTVVRISVTDTGKGIRHEFRDKVFNAFFTTKSAGEGSGLGLHIVKQIIDKHDGKIWFESEEGTGTTFIIELPFKNK